MFQPNLNFIYYLPKIIYFVFALFFSWYVFLIIYHLIRFGVGREPKIISFLFLFISLIVFFTFSGFYNSIDWKFIIETIFIEKSIFFPLSS